MLFLILQIGCITIIPSRRWPIKFLKAKGLPNRRRDNFIRGKDVLWSLPRSFVWVLVNCLYQARLDLRRGDLRPVMFPNKEANGSGHKRWDVNATK